ncbi:MAG: creatininase family protein [Candidatus Hermodarchaeota archaeon]
MLDKYLDYMLSKPSEIEEMIKTKPIAFIPFGALEWHGKHNILGVDSIKAAEICRRAANITGGVLFPCVNYGAFHTMNFPFTFHFSKISYVLMTRKLVSQLYKMGFRIIILLTGHYPTKQINQIKRVARKISNRHKDCFALGIPEFYLAPDLGYFGDHAASWETSMMMAINPKYVDLTQLTENLTFIERAQIHGILGKDPLVHASVEKGEEVLNLIVKRLSDAVLNVLNNKSTIYFDQIHDRYDKIKRENKRLGKLFETYGINNKKEGWDYLFWKIFKKGKYNPRFKKY